MERSPWLAHGLELLPGLLSWGLVVGSGWLVFSYPDLLVPAVLVVVAHWLVRVLALTTSVVVVQRRTRAVGREDWATRLATIDARPARRESLLRELLRPTSRAFAALGFSALARRPDTRRSARAELAALDAIDRLPEPPASPTEYHHVLVVAAEDGSLETLHATVGAAAEAHWPRERKILVIITRAGDGAAAEKVASLRAASGPAFGEVIHLVDALDPGVGPHGRSVLAFAARHLHRRLARDRGIDPARVLVTALAADERIDPAYLAHLTWTHLTSAGRATEFYRPMPTYSLGAWGRPMPARLIAALRNQMSMWQALRRGDHRGFGARSATLELIHGVGYWATDATPDDVRLGWRSWILHRGRSTVVPLFVPVHASAQRAVPDVGCSLATYLDPVRWARGASDFGLAVATGVEEARVPAWVRVRWLLGYATEHVAWVLAPVTLIGASLTPLVVPSAPGIVGVTPAAVALGMLALAALASGVLGWQAAVAAPPKPAEWGILHRGLSALQWIAYPPLALVGGLLPRAWS